LNDTDFSGGTLLKQKGRFSSCRLSFRQWEGSYGFQSKYWL